MEKINNFQHKSISRFIVDKIKYKRQIHNNKNFIQKNLQIIQNDYLDNYHNNIKKIIETQTLKVITEPTKEIENNQNNLNPNNLKSNNLNPNLQSINLQYAIDQGIRGKDVVVAVVDSGIIYNHPDIEKDRIIFYKDFSEESTQEKPKDILGHGTYVTSIIGGTGKSSNGYNQGIAPEAKFVILRITSVSEVIKALEWLKENGKKYNIKVINLSIGVDTDPNKSWADDVIAKLANDLAQEYTVVAAAGNDQTYETIDSPGVAPDVITVGGSDTKNTPSPEDDEVYIGSSKGPTPTLEKLPKPDVIAPSKKITGARVPGSILDPFTLKSEEINWEKGYYIESSGTSAGTAIVSGLAALIYQILPTATPQIVKKIITQSTNKLKDPQGQEYDYYSQGNGVIDIKKALQIAMEIKNQNPNLA
ncbi:MAG: S8 family serine peptidase [bacterium]